jgi:cell division protein FtsI/penicillin-binding protein 2
VVVLATVEGGGFGSDTAAPLVREILAAYYNLDPSEIEEPAGGAAEVAE